MVGPETVAEYIAALDAYGGPLRAVTMTRYEHGENHAVYRVRCSDLNDVERDVVVRVCTSDSKAERARAAREAAVLSHLDGAASPRLIDYRTDGPFAGRAVMCLEHIDGSHEPLDTAPGERLTPLGAAVQRVHSLSGDDLATTLDAAPDLGAYVERRLAGMRVRLPLVRDPLPEEVQRRFSEVTAWVDRCAEQLCVLGEGMTMVLLHGDVSAGNVLWTPLPVLIDWEYARIGDPADEVGYLFGQNALGPEQRDAFWPGYGRDVDPASPRGVVERAALWEPITLYGSALWWLDLWSRRVLADASGSPDPSAPKDASYYLGYVTRYLNRVALPAH